MGRNAIIEIRSKDPQTIADLLINKAVRNTDCGKRTI